ncbi:hypothetical protein [Prosthecobacter sp.]|jgi:predicted membrane channel-forming protein YqfA (hemolysin III family)
MNHELLTPIGTIGWFAMLVIGPIRSGRFGELFLPVFLGMAIIDCWAVAPAALRKDPSLTTVIYTWSGALFPYGVLIYWMIKTLIWDKKD